MFLSRRSFILYVSVCLFAALLFTGCSTDSEDAFENVHFVPIGEWTDAYGGGYNITGSTLEYYTAEMEWEGVTYPGFNMKGDILIANDFSGKAGVLLIKITSSDVYGLAANKYTGVYYRDYTSSHVFLVNPIDESYVPIQTDTLAQAESLFTVDNVGNHVQDWGSGYGK